MVEHTPICEKQRERDTRRRILLTDCLINFSIGLKKQHDKTTYKRNNLTTGVNGLRR